MQIKLDDGDKLGPPAGAQGNASVHAGQVQIAAINLTALMRITSWSNYLGRRGGEVLHVGVCPNRPDTPAVLL